MEAPHCFEKKTIKFENGKNVLASGTGVWIKHSKQNHPL